MRDEQASNLERAARSVEEAQLHERLTTISQRLVKASRDLRLIAAGDVEVCTEHDFVSLRVCTRCGETAGMP